MDDIAAAVSDTGPTFVLSGAGGSVKATVTDATSGPVIASLSGAANVSSVGNKSVFAHRVRQRRQHHVQVACSMVNARAPWEPRGWLLRGFTARERDLYMLWRRMDMQGDESPRPRPRMSYVHVPR